MKQLTRFLAWITFVALSAGAHAQEWPTKPIRVILPLPPGTAPDITMRLLGDRFSRMWGQPVVIENRPGANGSIGMQAGAKAPADGYTFVFNPAFVYTLVHLMMKNPGFDLDRDFAPVARVAGTPMLIAANPQFAGNTISEIIQLAKAQPGKINVGNPGFGSVPHLVVEMLNQTADISLYNVPFSGTIQSISAAMNNDVQLVVDGTSPLMPHVKSGKLKLIAVTSSREYAGLDGYPLAKATLPGFEVMGWFGIVAPKGVPAVVIQRVNTDVNKVLEIPEIIDRFRDIGTYPMPGTVQDFADFLREERLRWAKIVKGARIEPQ